MAAAPREHVRVVDGQQLRLPRRMQRGELAPHPGEPLDPGEHPALDGVGVVAESGRLGVEPRSGPPVEELSDDGMARAQHDLDVANDWH